MSSLPPISHRMFVEALQPESAAAEPDLVFTDSTASNELIVLELLHLTEPLPDMLPRPLRASGGAGAA